MEKDILSLLYKNSVENPGHLIMTENGQSISVKCLWEYISAVANYLEGTVSDDEYFVIALPNSIHWVLAVLGAMLAGVPTILLDWRIKDEWKEYLSGIKIGLALVTDDCTAISANKNENNRIINELYFDRIIENEDNRYPLNIEKINQRYRLVLFTSGTTGCCKGVVHSFSGITKACDNYIRTTHISDTDTLCAAVPLCHSYGFGSCFMAGLCSGARLILIRQFKAAEVIRIIEEERVTVFHGVPIMYDVINRYLRGKKYALECLRLCISAGAPLSYSIYKDFFDSTGIYISHELGSTETGTISINLNSGSDSVYGLVGPPLEGVKIRIHPTTGELWVNSSGRPSGYLQSKNIFSKWQKTDDVVNIIEGKIQIIGRRSMFINVAGKKVNPYEVESVIKSIDGVADVAVFGENDRVTNEHVCANIVKSSENISEKDIREICILRLAAYKVPKRIQFVSGLSKTALGKNKKNQE